MLIGLLGTEVSVNKQELEGGPVLYLFQVPGGPSRYMDTPAPGQGRGVESHCSLGRQRWALAHVCAVWGGVKGELSVCMQGHARAWLFLCVHARALGRAG